MNADRLVHDLSATQGGVVRLDQALECGMTRHQIKYRVRSGLWSPLGRGAYLVTAMVSVADRLRGAIAALPGAVVAHEAAAEIYGLRYVEAGLATVLVHSQTTHEFPGVTVRRCHDLNPGHVTTIDGLATTTIPRTIVDLAAIVTKKNLAAVVDDAVAADKVSIAEVAKVAAEIGRSGKPGTRNMRAILEERSGPGLRGTGLERKGNRLLLTIDGDPPTFEYPIPWRPEKRIDAAYPPERLGIEWDSRRWHTQVAAFEIDRIRDREAILHGWRILRFTWVDVTERPDLVIATVRETLGR